MKKAVEKIIKAREDKGLTQTDMANKLDIGLRMYQKIEAGQFPKYKRDQVKEIEKILGINIYELIYELPEASLSNKELTTSNEIAEMAFNNVTRKELAKLMAKVYNKDIQQVLDELEESELLEVASLLKRL